MKTIKLDMQDIHIGSLMLVNEEHPVRAQDITRFLNPLPLDTFNKNILLEAKTAALLSQLLKTIDSRSRIIPVSGY